MATRIIELTHTPQFITNNEALLESKGGDFHYIFADYFPINIKMGHTDRKIHIDSGYGNLYAWKTDTSDIFLIVSERNTTDHNFSLDMLFKNGEQGFWLNAADAYQTAYGLEKSENNDDVGFLSSQLKSNSLEISVPAFVDWTPHVKVFNDFSTSFNEDDFKLPATTSVWLSLTGNDTSGDGSEEKPFRTFAKVTSHCDSLNDSTINVFVKAGIYERIGTWRSSPTKDLNVIAVGGEVVFSTKYEALTWTQHSVGVYKATRSGIGRLIDENQLNQYGVALDLMAVDSIILCETTPNSYFIEGTTLYVHRQDATAPDTRLKIISNLTGTTLKPNQKYFIKGVIFEGGLSGSIYAPMAYSVVMVNCKNTYSLDNGFRISGCNNSLAVNCEVYGNIQDGFNYHADTNGISPYATEINCKSYCNGLADNNDNGSTAHEDCRVLRVNCEYYDNKGPNLVDVGTVRSWNINVKSENSRGEGLSQAEFYAGTSAMMGFNSCKAKGVNAAVVTGTSVIRYKNTELDGTVIGNVKAGYATKSDIIAYQLDTNKCPKLIDGEIVFSEDHSLQIELQDTLSGATMITVSNQGLEILSDQIISRSYQLRHNFKQLLVVNRDLTESEKSNIEKLFSKI